MAAADELNEVALALEHQALALPRHLAACVLAVALARVVGESPPADRAKTQEAVERGYRETLAEYDARRGEAA